jgi:hypothetical protein
MESEYAGGPMTAVYEAMDAAEPSQAVLALSTLVEQLHDQGADTLDLNRAWEAFKRLLERRGYYVDTPARLATSLKEIDGVGAGFDLYDLARSLARYDVVRTKCRKLAGSRSLPELQAFASPCRCSRRRKEK